MQVADEDKEIKRLNDELTTHRQKRSVEEGQVVVESAKAEQAKEAAAAETTRAQKLENVELKVNAKAAQEGQESKDAQAEANQKRERGNELINKGKEEEKEGKQVESEGAKEVKAGAKEVKVSAAISKVTTL